MEDVAANDAKLSALLRRWPGIRPRPDFTDAVRRRIRNDAFTPARRGFWSPPAAVAAAAVIGIALGAGLGRWSSPASVRHGDAAVLLHAETLAGGYAALTGGRP